MKANFEVDASQVLEVFKNLNSKQMKKVHKNTLKEAAKIVQKAGRKSLASIGLKNVKKPHTWKDGSKTALWNGIKITVGKNADYSKVHLFGDPRLKWFEMGTKPRYKKMITGNKAVKDKWGNWKTKAVREYSSRSTGSIKASHFFANAQKSSEREVFNSMEALLKKSILKVAKKK